MPENNEKVEDFISLWKKKMESEMKKPSVIGDTLDKIKIVENENEELRNKIKQNIDLISRSEKLVKETIEENERLKEQISKMQNGGATATEIIKQESIKLKDKIKTLERMILEKDEELNEKEKEIAELRIESYSTTTKPDIKANTTSNSESNLTNTLIEDLQSELSKKKSLITEYEQTLKTKDDQINELTKENENLNEQLIEKLKKLPIDYVVPVSQPNEYDVKPQPKQTSSKTLELLCQDLQSDLNRAKGLIKNLTEEKSELKLALEKGGFQLEPNEIKELKQENEDLRIEISKLQNSLKSKSEEAITTTEVNNFEKIVKDLQMEIKEKDNLIAKLHTSKTTQKTTPSGPMTNLIEDLQNRINKLRLELEEKNKIIEELKSS